MRYKTVFSMYFFNTNHSSSKDKFSKPISFFALDGLALFSFYLQVVHNKNQVIHFFFFLIKQFLIFECTYSCNNFNREISNRRGGRGRKKLLTKKENGKSSCHNISSFGPVLLKASLSTKSKAQKPWGSLPLKQGTLMKARLRCAFLSFL